MVSQGLITVDDYINANLVHSVHTTERRSIRGCRRRWHWIFKDGYYPLTTAKPLEFGIAYHKAMEVWYDPDMWGIDREVAYQLARQTFIIECKKQRQNYLDNTRQTELEAEVREDYDERITLGLGMLQEYAKVSAELDANIRPVFVEKPFEAPITGRQGETIWCKCQRCWRRYVAYYDQNPDKPSWPEGSIGIKVVDRMFGSSHWHMWQGLPVTYGGRIDMLAQDIDERYWVYDWKTAARLSTGEPGSPDDFLFLDDQITSYCWALATKMNIDVAGFVYHEQKKAFPVEPEPMRRARLGCLYSKNKQMDCDWKTYETTVRENDVAAYEAGYYDEFIEYLREFGGVFHKRHQIHRTPTELSNAGFNIFDEASDITDVNLRIYPSPGRFACTYCAFNDPCLGKNRGDDYTYTLDTMFEKRQKHYFQESSTDKPDRA